jgi:hypothetical protein
MSNCDHSFLDTIWAKDHQAFENLKSLWEDSFNVSVIEVNIGGRFVKLSAYHFDPNNMDVKGYHETAHKNSIPRRDYVDIDEKHILFRWNLKGALSISLRDQFQDNNNECSYKMRNFYAMCALIDLRSNEKKSPCFLLAIMTTMCSTLVQEFLVYFPDFPDGQQIHKYTHFDQIKFFYCDADIPIDYDSLLDIRNKYFNKMAWTFSPASNIPIDSKLRSDESLDEYKARTEGKYNTSNTKKLQDNNALKLKMWTIHLGVRPEVGLIRHETSSNNIVQGTNERESPVTIIANTNNNKRKRENSTYVVRLFLLS